MSTLTLAQRALREYAQPEKAAFYPRFFKAGSGEYAEGDRFLGVTVPKQRLVAKQFYETVSIEEALELLKSPWHEERLTALFICVLKYQKSDSRTKGAIVKFYLDNTQYVNNWDLVDSSAPYILGNWLLDKDKTLLYKLAASSSLWERRIAIIATLEFIRHDEYSDTIAIAALLLGDTHDLLHKAVGWCLREAGKRSPDLLTAFLDEHAGHMPRTTLRYAIERLPEPKRKYYLNLR
jgi:3-methyladenine DNA glycosylase AlkD